MRRKTAPAYANSASRGLHGDLAWGAGLQRSWVGRWRRWARAWSRSSPIWGTAPGQTRTKIGCQPS
jgi:hypothetical protein